MDGLKRHTNRMNPNGSFMPAPDQNALEDNCLLCGNYLPLDKDGYCLEDSCKDAARAEIRKRSRANNNKNIPGMYYQVNGKEVFMFYQLETYQEPEVPQEFTDANGVKHIRKNNDPDLVTKEGQCEIAGCEYFARPNDTVCSNHRKEVVREEYRARKNKSVTKSRFIKKPSKPVLTHRIKGLPQKP